MMEKDNFENNSGKWIWGIFYYNKEDERVFPPKRIPWMGWTVNFANWKSIAALVAMLAFFYFIIFMIERNS
ncbi:MAG: hypothetical protein I8H78_11570 [Flavobacteriales bacterium]|nr:hypothetical protein [Flavobacteriales bacterium]